METVSTVLTRSVVLAGTVRECGREGGECDQGGAPSGGQRPDPRELNRSCVPAPGLGSAGAVGTPSLSPAKLAAGPSLSLPAGKVPWDAAPAPSTCQAGWAPQPGHAAAPLPLSLAAPARVGKQLPAQATVSPPHRTLSGLCPLLPPRPSGPPRPPLCSQRVSAEELQHPGGRTQGDVTCPAPACPQARPTHAQCPFTGGTPGLGWVPAQVTQPVHGGALRPAGRPWWHSRWLIWVDMWTLRAWAMRTHYKPDKHQATTSVSPRRN